MMSLSSTASSNGTRTLGQMYTRIEGGLTGAGARRVVVRARGAGGWEDTPGWRFFRNVVRVALYMRERAGLMPGWRVAVVAPMRPERLLVEWATVAQGGVIAVIDPRSSDDALAAALSRFSPKMVFVAGKGNSQRMKPARAGGRMEHVVSFDDESDNGVMPWKGLLDLAGTLDSAERAQAFRASARELRSEMPAIAHLEARSASWTFTTHGNVVSRMVEFWDRFPPRRGETAFVVDPGGPASLRLPLWAFVADGESTLVIGTPGREEEELAEVRPGTIAMPLDALPLATRSAIQAEGRAGTPATAGATALGWLTGRSRTSPHDVRPARRVFTLEGDARSLT
jgi:hypothetical protein